MLWRVRCTLPDRPGSLATLAASCGDAGVNILGLQIFPGVEAVTDELVLRTPDAWGDDDIAGVVCGSGGRSVSAVPCTEAALVDQPSRYVQAARAILAAPARFPEVVAGLFDAEPAPSAGGVQDVMEMTVDEVHVQVRRTASFTATEHARGAALADLVSDVLGRQGPGTPIPSTDRRLGRGAAPDYGSTDQAVSATVDGVVVGRADLAPQEDEVGQRSVVLRVDPAWQRRGIGTRLLSEVARLAASQGSSEIVLTTRSDNQAVLPMVLSAGLRGRIRMSADDLTVRVPLRELRVARV